MLQDAKVEAAKALPPIAATLAVTSGMSLADWLTVATIVYIGLQAAYLVWKWYREYRGPDRRRKTKS